MEERMPDDARQSELYDKGLAMRREVLGAEYVDRSIANADAFNQPFQKLVTEWCWGEIWSRPRLSKKMRSMINLAMLTALNRPNELRLHVRGALNNGVSREEIQESCCRPPSIAGFPQRSKASRSRPKC
jgi:4-carboxymuconolactone decarboxylase